MFEASRNSVDRIVPITAEMATSHTFGVEKDRVENKNIVSLLDQPERNQLFIDGMPVEIVESKFDPVATVLAQCSDAIALRPTFDSTYENRLNNTRYTLDLNPFGRYSDELLIRKGRFTQHTINLMFRNSDQILIPTSDEKLRSIPNLSYQDYVSYIHHRSQEEGVVISPSQWQSYIGFYINLVAILDIEQMSRTADPKVLDKKLVFEKHLKDIPVAGPDLREMQLLRVEVERNGERARKQGLSIIEQLVLSDSKNPEDKRVFRAMNYKRVLKAIHKEQYSQVQRAINRAYCDVSGMSLQFDGYKGRMAMAVMNTLLGGYRSKYFKSGDIDSMHASKFFEVVLTNRGKIVGKVFGIRQKDFEVMPSDILRVMALEQRDDLNEDQIRHLINSRQF